MANSQGAETDRRDLGALFDRSEIEDALVRYCRGVDRLDAALLRTVFWPDAWDDHGFFAGRRDDFIDWVIPFLRERYSSASHLVANHLIELHGDIALSECYFDAVYHYASGGTEYTKLSRGRYIDRFERRGNRWRIARRKVVNDWARSDPVTAPAPLKCPGERSKEDPSYQLRETYLAGMEPQRPEDTPTP